MKKVSVFSPNLPLLKAVRQSNSAVLTDLCAISGLDPSSDFKQLSFADVDFRGSDLSSFIIDTDLPKHVTAEQMKELAEQVSSPLPEKIEETGFKPFLHSVVDAVNEANLAIKRDGRISGIPTGFHDLDLKIGGLNQSDLIVLAAAPSMGKTALVTQIAFNVAKATQFNDSSARNFRGGNVGFFSLQLKAGQLAQRILALECEVPVENIQRGDLTEPEFRRYVDAAKTLESIPLFIDDTFGGAEALVARAVKLKREVGLNLLVIDMIDDLSENRTSATRHATEIEGILKAFKHLARSEDICVLVTSNIGKAILRRSDKRPKITDLNEIGVVSQVADTVLFLHREEFYTDQQRPEDYDLQAMAEWTDHMERVHGVADVIVAKQRNGAIGTVELSFESKYVRFGNLVKPWQELEGY